MKIKTHYAFGKQNKVACGRKGGFMTTNFLEINCKSCLKTYVHRNVKGAKTPVTKA